MSLPVTFAVGSENPIKIKCVMEAVSEYWTDCRVIGVPTTSGVSNQPMSEHEMYLGALNRAKEAVARLGEAAFGVGLEGGIVDQQDGMWAFAVIVITDREGRISEGQTGRFRLPEGVARLVREEGLELGEADDRFFGRQNSKQNEGAIGILSDGRITRSDLYRPAVVFALLPFLHPEYYDPVKPEVD